MKQLIYCLALLWPLLSMCSKITIRGNIINSSGYAVVGATVTLLQTNQSTSTDSSGEFVLKGSSALDSIRISCPGYETTTVPNNERGIITVLLKRSFKNPKNPVLKPLAIGDTMPPFLLSNAINWPQKEIDLSQLKNQLVILDFWATWCNSCLKGFASLDSLQQLFPLQLQPILVNNTISTADTGQKVHSYLIKRNQSPKTSIRLPVAIEDGPALQQLFPHVFLPHYVWLFNNKVIAITSASELTKENIHSVLNGKHKPMKHKQDTQ